MLKNLPHQNKVFSLILIFFGLVFSTHLQAAGLLVASGGSGGKLKVEEHTVKVTSTFNVSPTG